ncbi:putative phosphatidate phosphatase isoform X1 [Artemia franciscana]|uniref:Phosphatidic acid phosphatase type 2/haloperoxidase domain-containing protein n=2 Tax=Artemia franciscana TaxID=6661 RepID=A0AA88I8C7_ARTSF|nr:hypothetical protein QYM36_001071 [Artemia franciscana]
MASPIIQFILDFVALVIVWLPVLLFFLIGDPYKRGFYCFDESLNYPFKDSTISSLVLFLVGVFLPVLSMITVEWIKYSQGRRGRYLPQKLKIGKFTLHPLVIELGHLIGAFLFGAGCSQLATDVGKYSIGRLRPHFMDVCKPNLELLCPPGVSPTKYIEDFTCVEGDAYLLKNSRLSFPSGHASFSAYTMMYLAIYLQARMTWKGSKFLRPVFQAIALFLFWFTALSRVSDYKHHWSDVLAGAALGITIATLTALYVSHLFKFVPEDRLLTGDTKMDQLNGMRSAATSSEFSPMKSVIVDNIL